MENKIITYWNKEIFSQLLEDKLSVDELLILYCLYHDKREIVQSYYKIENPDKYVLLQQLEVEGYLLREDDNKLTELGESVVERFMNLWGVSEYQSEKVIEEDDVFKENILKYTSLFSKRALGLTDKSCNPNDVLFKFRKLFKENPECTWDDILGATAYRIEEMRASGRLKFIRKANYFVYKRVDQTKESEVSDLLLAITEWKESSEDNKGSLLADNTI